MLVVKVLETLRKKALRRDFWFKTLSKVERGIVDLCIKVKRGLDVKSITLLGVLIKIIKKIVKMLKNSSNIESWIIGFKKAFQVSQLAVNWGYKEAREWTQNLNFITYLVKIWTKPNTYHATSRYGSHRAFGKQRNSWY
jgi:hypothetical protein